MPLDDLVVARVGDFHPFDGVAAENSRALFIRASLADQNLYGYMGLQQHPDLIGYDIYQGICAG